MGAIDLDEMKDQVATFAARSPALYGKAVLKGMDWVFKRNEGLHGVSDVSKTDLGEEGASRQHSRRGRRPHPFNMHYASRLTTANPYHGAALAAKANAMVGFGFVKAPLSEEEKAELASIVDNPLGRLMPEVVLADAQKYLDARQSRVEQVLDPLCNGSFQSVMHAVALDYVTLANAAIEVVRTDGEITGLHYLPMKQVWVHTEDNVNLHYQVEDNPMTVIGHDITNEFVHGSLGGTSLHTRKFAQFGDLDRFAEEFSIARDTTSEVIHFFQPNQFSRHYGYPEWLSAVPHIRASQCMLQQQFAWFYHRAVPEFALFLIGAKLDKENWDAIKSTLTRHSGPDGAYRTLAANIDSPDVRVQVERLGLDGGADVGNTKLDDIATRGIVSAHRIPEGLANVQARGKPGAANERANDIMTFQLLNIGPLQFQLETILGCTLGKREVSGLDLEPGDFRFRTITQEIDLALFSDVGRAKQPLTEALAEGRDMNEGVLD